MQTENEIIILPRCRVCILNNLDECPDELKGCERTWAEKKVIANLNMEAEYEKL